MIRKKFIPLTPEEWVRQHLIAFLVNYKNFPSSLLAVEKGLKVNRLSKRTDVVAYGKDGKPLMIAECKAPSCIITQDTFDQAARYNMSLNVKYLSVTNGIQHFTCLIDHERKRYVFLREMPEYERL